MRDGEPQIYTSLATLRNGYIQLQWSRVQIFFAYNVIAFPLVFGTVQITRPELVKFILSAVGAWIHIALLNAALRADNWIKYFDDRMVQLEQLDQEDQSGVRVPVFSHPDFTAIRHSWFASRRLFGIVGLAVTATWLEEAIRRGYILFR